jgi:hypothetical protein
MVLHATICHHLTAPSTSFWCRWLGKSYSRTPDEEATASVSPAKLRALTSCRGPIAETCCDHFLKSCLHNCLGQALVVKR